MMLRTLIHDPVCDAAQEGVIERVMVGRHGVGRGDWSEPRAVPDVAI
jgi:hypothetical protein